MLNFVLNGLLEIPAYVISLYVIQKGGRKLPYVLMIGLAGVALFCTIIIPENTFKNNWPIITLAMIGKLCITGILSVMNVRGEGLINRTFVSGSFGIIYVFSAETYPTIIRSIGVGSSSVFARLGGMVAPYVGALGLYLGVILLNYIICMFISRQGGSPNFSHRDLGSHLSRGSLPRHVYAGDETGEAARHLRGGRGHQNQHPRWNLCQKVNTVTMYNLFSSRINCKTWKNISQIDLT